MKAYSRASNNNLFLALGDEEEGNEKPEEGKDEKEKEEEIEKEVKFEWTLLT